MSVKPSEAVAILSRTPAALAAKLRGLPETWIRADEGQGTWSPFDVVVHLIHGEKAEWIPRIRIILAQDDDLGFEPADRFARDEDPSTRTLAQLLEEFASLRASNLKDLAALDLQREHLELTKDHPALGPVTLEQFLATWVVHDLDHLAQIDRVMACRWRDETGPWGKYLRILG